MFQKNAIQGLANGEKAIKMINDLGLFSDNESMDEVSTTELRWYIYPCDVIVGLSLSVHPVFNACYHGIGREIEITFWIIQWQCDSMFSSNKLKSWSTRNVQLINEIEKQW